ncbi:MAG: hypothetical protein AAF654_12000 [Myxococcota bacterium]
MPSAVDDRIEACARALEGGDTKAALAEATAATQAASELDLETRLRAERTALLVEAECGLFDQAERRADAMRLALEPSSPARALLLADLAHIAMLRGRRDDAETRLRTAIDVVDEVATEPGLAPVPVLAALAALLAARDRRGLDEAKQLTARVLDLLLEAGDEPLAVADTLAFRALLDARSGEFSGARTLSGQAIEIYTSTSAPRERIAAALMVAAEAAHALGQTEDARALRSQLAEVTNDNSVSNEFERALAYFARSLRLELRRSVGLG